MAAGKLVNNGIVVSIGMSLCMCTMESPVSRWFPSEESSAGFILLRPLCARSDVQVVKGWVQISRAVSRGSTRGGEDPEWRGHALIGGGAGVRGHAPPGKLRDSNGTSLSPFVCSSFNSFVSICMSSKCKDLLNGLII